MRIARIGSTEMMLTLLKAGGASDADNASEALLTASCRGHRNVATLLLNHGASVFKQDRAHGRTALMLAAEFGHPSVLTLLLSHGAPINARDPQGKSAIELAIDAGHAEVVEELLRQQARVVRAGVVRAGAAGAEGGIDPWEALLSKTRDAAVRSLLEGERQRQRAELELCEAELCDAEGGAEERESKKAKKKKKKKSAAVAENPAVAESAVVGEKPAVGEMGARVAQASVMGAAKIGLEPRADAQNATDDGGEVGGERDVAIDTVKTTERGMSEPAAVIEGASQDILGCVAATAEGVTQKRAMAAAVEGDGWQQVGGCRVASDDEASDGDDEAARNLDTFGDSANAPGPAQPGDAQGWLPPSDLVEAGGRVPLEMGVQMGMETLAKQAASFSHAFNAERASGGGTGGGGANQRAHQRIPTESEHEMNAVDSLREQLQQLRLRVGAEQQCVVREQHITARMWLEKTQAEERVEQMRVQCEELQADVADWEAWHQTQRRQQRQRRQQAMRWAQNPSELLQVILGEMGLHSIADVQHEQQQRLAAALDAAAALLRGVPARPPGL